MAGTIRARKDRDGQFKFNGSRDAWEFEDTETGETYWVKDYAMQDCIEMHCEAYQKEGHSPEEARDLAHRDSHEDTWTIDERGVAKEEPDEPDPSHFGVRFRRGR